MFNIGDSITPDQAMRFAIEVAKQGRGFTSPNPLVGCVIVDRDHKYLSSGAHLLYGENHAEMNALLAVRHGNQLDQATVYVTLEPCAHEGKTGSCAKSLAELPLKKVFYGLLDPNPLVAGQGIDILKAKGIETEHFVRYQGACAEVCEQFLFHIVKKRPFVSLKVATGLDGKMALSNGESQWITEEEARQLGRKMRAHYDATMIGAGTFITDNPKLDFRGTEYDGKKDNKIILFDPRGKGAPLFPETQLARRHKERNIFVITRPENVPAWSKNMVPVVQWKDDTKEAWAQCLSDLYQKGICSIYVEGGSYVFGQFLKYNLAQKLYLFQAPKVMGQGKSWTEFLQIDSMDRVPSLERWQYVSVGIDRLNIAYFK